MSSAVLYFHHDAYDTGGARLMGRHSAGESFMRGYLRHATADTFHMWNVANGPLDKADALIRRIEPIERPIVWHPNRRRIGEVGVLNMPVPGLPGEAWARRPYGDQAYAICGVTHTTASAIIMQTVAEMLLTPLHDYDALICTSSAVRASIETELDGVRENLGREYGPRGIRRVPKESVFLTSLRARVAQLRLAPMNGSCWSGPDDAPWRPFEPSSKCRPTTSTFFRKTRSICTANHKPSWLSERSAYNSRFRSGPGVSASLRRSQDQVA